MALKVDGGSSAPLPKVDVEPRQQSSMPTVDLDQAKDLVTKGMKLHGSLKDGFEAAKKVKAHGLKTAYAKANKDLVEKAQSSNVKLTAGALAKKGLGVLGTATALAQLPGKAMTAAKDIRTALRTGKSADWNKALGATASAGKTLAIAARGTVDIAKDVHKFGAAYSAASAAFKAEVPNATRSLVRSAAAKAALTTMEGAGKGAAKKAVTEAVELAAKRGGTLAEVAGVADRAAARAALKAGGKAAAEAALEAGARSAAGPLARAAGRFAPGVNIAIAAFDTANAISTVRDPHASTGKKVTACITAVGSIAAATNIPVVSQVGAAVSVASSLIGGFFFSK